jgi:hypothetical protein
MKAISRTTALSSGWLICSLVLILVVVACGGKASPTAAPPAKATQSAGPQATQPPAATQPAAGKPTAAVPTPATAAPAAKVNPTTRPAAGKFADPDDLNSYRMKTTMWEKGGDKAKASVILIEWVKSSAAKRTVMGDIETITIGDKTWVKIMGNWVLQDRPPQSQPGQTADLMKQIEDKIVYKEVGRETVNGVACKKYTYSGEATVQISEGALKGEATVRGQGEAWVADQPGLPAVIIRNRGESETKLPGAALPAAKSGDLTVAMNVEMDLYDINQPITIKPPETVMTIPTAPAATSKVTPPALATRPALPGQPQLTAVPELRACFESFPLYPNATADQDAARMATMIAVGLGSPSEGRGYRTSDLVSQVQAFFEKQAAAAGWTLGPFMLGQPLQYWSKDKFLVVLNVIAPTQERKETFIAITCGADRSGAAAAPTRAAATPTRAAAAAPAAAPAGETTTVDFEKPLDRNWYAQGGVGASISVEARPGFLRFTAGSGNDLFPGTNFDAPTRYRVIGGDFTLETAVEFDPQEDFQGAGLFIWQDEENFVRLERCFGGLGGIESGICFLKVAKGEPESIMAAGGAPTAAKRVELRLQKSGNRVAAWWRDPAAGVPAAWQSLGDTEIELPGGPQPLTQSALRGGMLLCVEHGAAEISADFDYLKITQ